VAAIMLRIRATVVIAPRCKGIFTRRLSICRRTKGFMLTS
jgi:hypothetical protein